MSKAGGGVYVPPPPPHGYVEPVPEVYRAVERCFGLLGEKIGSLGFPEDKALERTIKDLQDVLEKLIAISNKQLSGKTLTTEQ